jgi:F-type H+-transporting ATPase subunit a
MLSTTHAAAENEIAIHLAPEVLGSLWGMPITNTLLSVWLVMVILAVITFFVHGNLRLRPNKSQVAVELLIGGSYDYIRDTLGTERLARTFFPLIMSIFVFILAINWIGLLPGVDAIGFYGESHGEEIFKPFLHPGNTDLNITIAFAIIAFVAIEVAGVVLLGFLKYTGKFVNLRFLREFSTANILAFFIGIIELFSEIARLISFSFRLFGNIFAGKTLIVIAMFFVPFVLPVPLLAFELFVGFIQAFIFAILTLFFIKLAIEEPH